MAGIYLHVPYCKVKCHYCDFHFSTRHQSIPAMAAAMLKELDVRSSYLAGQTVSTIYFGGGTPSLFSGAMIGEIIDTIRDKFAVSSDAEITLECNPDDLDVDRVRDFKTVGINRLSIGIQSFDDDVLRFMNRAHNNKQALRALDVARGLGFENITIDLIYGIPGKELDYWKQQLQIFAALNLPHLSSYCLTIEPKTYFGDLRKKGLLMPASDEAGLAEFQYLMDFVREQGMEQYEISNFARPGFISRHNSAYWLGSHYLGIGPSAHSYNGVQRGWNVANNAKYIEQIDAGTGYHQTETLSASDRFNDYVMTRLRTKWGINPADLDFVPEAQRDKLVGQLRQYGRQAMVQETAGVFVLTDAGKYRADGIAADLFI